MMLVVFLYLEKLIKKLKVFGGTLILLHLAQ